MTHGYCALCHVKADSRHWLTERHAVAAWRRDHPHVGRQRPHRLTYEDMWDLAEANSY